MTMTPEKASTANFTNSVAEYMAAKLLDIGYIVYWQELDGVQTPDGWYYQYSTQSATYLADPTFLGRANAALGLVAIVPAIPAEPRFIARPTVDGIVLSENQVAIPAAAIEIAAPDPKFRFQLGSTEHWRRRRLTLDVYTRTASEQQQWQDWFALWFDPDVRIPIRDHESTGAVLEDAWCQMTRIDSNTVLYRAEAEAFQVVLNTFLEYIA
jgi:hypothetical protein